MTASKREPRSSVLAFRVTKQNYDDFARKANEANMSLRQWFEEALVLNKTYVVARRKTTSDVRALLVNVNWVGNNMNQIAHNLNAQTKAGTLTRDECILALDKLDHLRAMLFEAVRSCR